MVKEPTQTNAADGFTNALQTAKNPEWWNRLGMGRLVGVSAACGSTLGVDGNTGAANVWDKKAGMERLELAKKGLSELREQPWLAVGVCS